MERIYVDFFRELLKNSGQLSSYVDALYEGDEYSEDDLNHIFGVLKKEGLIVCNYADNRAWVHSITFTGKHFFDVPKLPRLAELIDESDEIEKMFHAVGVGAASVETIYDVQAFQDWLQEINLELRAIHDRTKDHFIWETLNSISKPMNGWNDRQVFAEIKGKLKAIRRNIDKYYPHETENDEGMIDSRMEKQPKVFISHSSKDRDYVAQIVNLLDGMGLDQTQVFCSSLPGYGIPIDTNIFDYLRSQFLEFDLHVFFVHSENYYKSPISLNEMGAAWALKNTVTSILLPGFGFDQMTGVVNNQSISIKLDGQLIELQDKLNQLYAKVVSEFHITKKADIIWQQKRYSFIDEIARISGTDNRKSALISDDALKLLKEAATDPSGQVLKSSDLSNGTSIQGGRTVMNANSTPRESARWIAALEELLNAGLLLKADSKGAVFQVSDAGYKYIDEQ